MQQKFDLTRLAALCRITKENAQRIWEIWVETRAYELPSDEGSAEFNRLKAFCLISSLPTEAVQKYMRGCREFEKSLSR
jgi:hypothetical protein